MNIRSFMALTEEIKTLKTFPNTFWNRRKLKKAQKALDKMIRAAAQQEADKMFDQAYKFYYDLIDKNLV